MRKTLAILALLTFALLVVVPPSTATTTYCVYLAIFQGSGCPVPVPVGGTGSADICVLCPPGWGGECKNFKPTNLLRIRGTLCLVSLDVPKDGQTNCSTCPTGLGTYSLERDNGIATCSVNVDDGLDNDSDGLIDEESCDGLDNDGDGRVDEDTYSAWLSNDVVGIGDTPHPDRFELTLDGPNPARDILQYDLAIPAAGRIRVGLYDLAGHQVASIMQQQLPVGRHPFLWRRTSAVASGMYFLRLEGERVNLSRKVVFLQ